MKLNPHKLGLAGAIFAALTMILFTGAHGMGIYNGAVTSMQNMHAFYTPTFGGTITGMIEAALMTYVSLYLVAWIYNRLLDTK